MAQPGAPDAPLTTAEMDVAGGSPQAQAAAGFINALAKAARAFVLYDPSNALVRQFLGDYQERAGRALALGPLALEVRPEEIAAVGEVIYREPDRERSLAYRLFRDGVRRVSIEPGVPWPELLRVLEILAIRFTGIRQSEDDVVTLIRSAGFRGIAIEAVEGFRLEDEEAQGEGHEDTSALQLAPPPGWDEPLPRLPAPAALAHRPVAAEALRDLRAELDPAALPATALSAVRDLLAEAARSGWPNPYPELDGFAGEVGTFLLSEGDLVRAKELAAMLARGGRAAAAAAVARHLEDPQTYLGLLAKLPDDAREAPPHLAPLLAMVPLDGLVDALGPEERPARRALLLGLVRARLPADGAALAARLPSAGPALAGDLLRTLAEGDPDRIPAAATALLAQPDRALQDAALAGLEAARCELPTVPLARLLAGGDEARRIRVLDLFGARGEPAAFHAVERWAEERRELSDAEADAAGRALASIGPIPASRVFARWAEKEKGLLGGLRKSGRKQALMRAAASGLEVIALPDAEARLHALAQAADGDLRGHCLAAMARRRTRGHPHG
ncbi:MAG TPA: hypothetical protein VLU43_08105 [Anaeromyxobacteraceae bacterium]|nr:hypothetical protein [Anaeromyxobacteraceae bacterium]